MILVTGATGFIGSRLVKRLVKEGHGVRAMVVKNDPLLPSLEGLECEIVEGDITEKESLKPCLEGVHTVFHLAAVLVSHNPRLFDKINYEGTRNVVDVTVEAGVEHFIYMSAAAAAYKIRTTYGESKLKAEELMQARGNTQFTIIRPTILYGSGGSQELKIYIENLRKFPLIVPMLGMGKALKRPVWVEDIINGLVLTINRPVSYGKKYNFSGGSAVTMWEFTKIICTTFSINKPMIPVPTWLCYFLSMFFPLFVKQPVLRRDTILGITMDADFSFEQARVEIGYSPVSLEKGFNISYSNLA